MARHSLLQLAQESRLLNQKTQIYYVKSWQLPQALLSWIHIYKVPNFKLIVGANLMSELAIIIAIAVPILLLLFAMVLVGRKQQKLSLRRSQARFVRQKAEDLTDALEFLMSVDNQRDIQLSYMHRIAYLYRMYLQMLPKKDVSVQSSSFNVEVFEQKIRQEKPLQKVFRSDQEIYNARKQFSILLKALGPMSKQLKLGANSQEQYRRHLRIILLEREFDSLLALSDVSVQKQDKSAATEYLKLAKQRVMMIDFNYDPKAEKIQEINEKMTALYQGDRPDGDNLSKGFDKMIEEEEFDESGFPLDPGADKRKF